MKTKLLLTFLPVWVCSLGLAYWVGSSRSGDHDAARDSTPTAPGAFRPSSVVVSDYSQSSRDKDLEGSPLDTIRHLAARPEELGRWIAVDDALANIRPSEAREALDWVMQLPPGQKRDGMVLDLVERWATLDPDAAMAYLGNIESLRLRDRATGMILETWGRSDPAAAMAWLNQHAAGTPTRTLNQRVLSVIEGYAQSDPGGAFHYSTSLPEDTAAQRELKSRALRDVMRQMVGQEKISEAVTLLNALPDGNTRTNAFGDLIQEWAQYDPYGAAQHINILGEDAASEAKRALVRSWAQYDPEAAASWLSSLSPNDPEIGNLVTSLVGNWTRYDLEASAAWLNQMPPSPEIDRAVAIYTFRSAQEDPAGAMSWAESITRDETRNRLMTRVAAEWRQQDPQAFQAYLDSTDLPEDQKTRLQNAQSGGGGPGGRWWGRGGGRD